MIESATANRATERRQATATRLTQLCRRLTAERGLAGFTIDEACSEIGISRRTFFNYFPSKEEAVFGIDESDELRRFSEDFLALASRGWPAVVDDLVGFIVAYVQAEGHDMTEHTLFMSVLEREPKLLARFMGLGREREAQLVELVALRENVPTSDTHARASVDVFTTIMRSTAERLSDPRVAADFGAALLESLTALRDVLAPRKALS